jgi:hypothetical protein
MLLQKEKRSNNLHYHDQDHQIKGEPTSWNYTKELRDKLRDKRPAMLKWRCTCMQRPFFKYGARVCISYCASAFAANAAACQYVSGVELMLVLLVIRCYSLNVRLLVCLLPAARRAIHPLFFFPPVWEAYRPYTSSNRSGPPGNRQLGRHTPGQAHLNSVLMCVIVVNERMMTM